MAINVYGNQPAKQIKRDIEIVDKKVYGMQYPLKAGTRGVLSKQSGTELVKNNLIQLLRTERGERVMLPNFGTSLKRYLFEQLDRTTFRSIQAEILGSISTYMPNVEVVKLTVLNNEEVSPTGLQGLYINLVVKLNEFQDNLIEVEVNLV